MLVQLYDYQREARDSVLQHLETESQALVVMACGLGKTYLAAAILEKLIQKESSSEAKEPKKNLRTLVLCHNNEILEQSQLSFHEVLGDKITSGLFHGMQKDFEEVDVLFASIQTMIKWKDAFLKGEFDILFVDECHHGKAATFEPTITYFDPKYLIALTATPDRMDNLDIRDIFGEEVVNIPLQVALAKGYLTPVEYHVMNGNLSKGALKKLIREEFPEDGKTIAKRISKKQLNETIFIERRDEEIARIILEQDLQTIIFSERIEHAENFKPFIEGSQTIHCKKSSKQNSRIINKFRRKELQHILVVDMLNEGIDIPTAELIVFLRCTDSIPLYLQQLGRGLRKARGKSKVIVFDFVANAERLLVVSEFGREIKASCHDDLEQDLIILRGNSFEFIFSDEMHDVQKVIDSIAPTYVSDIPNLAAEYHPEKNELSSDEVIAGTSKKLWWRCSKCQHEWQATGSHRTRGSGCPACANLVVTATNNLAATHPRLAREYMDDKNTLPADQVNARTYKKLWWKCRKCGHEWQARSNHRANGVGCPACANLVVTATNNLAVTHPELAQEYLIEKNRLPANKIISGTKKKLWWKCEKCGHEWQAPGEKRVKGSGCPSCSSRTVTEKNNLTITHPQLAQEFMIDRNGFAPDQVIAGTMKKLWWKCGKCGYEWQSTGNSRVTRGTGCPSCAGRVVSPTNNLAATHPQLAQEYMEERNDLPADKISAGTCKKLWWKCSKCGYEWQARGTKRKSGAGCHACAGKVATATNNLAVARPELVKEYMFDRNELLPDKIVSGSKKRLWWRCEKCGHEWQTSVHHRVKGSGCPECAKEKRKRKK